MLNKVKEFSKDIKPREIFVYTCERVAEPLTAMGFKYRKSKNDIIKLENDFVYKICFQPSIKFGSTTFLVHIGIESDKLADWRPHRYKNENNDVSVFSTSLARLTKRAADWPTYTVDTFTERERSINEISHQIRDFALPFFEQFQDIQSLIIAVQSKGFISHRKGLYDKKRVDDFINCFGSSHLSEQH